MKKQPKIRDIQGSKWIIDILDKLHPDYKDAHIEAVETKHIPEGTDEVVTRYRLLIHEKDGTTSFVGDSEGAFTYPNMTLATRDLETFRKWKAGEM